MQDSPHFNKPAVVGNVHPDILEAIYNEAPGISYHNETGRKLPRIWVWAFGKAS